MTSFNYCDIRVFLVSLVFCWYIPQSVYSIYYVYVVIALFAALQCYACSWTALDPGDASCVTNASAVRSLNCSMKYCLTVRQELMVSRKGGGREERVVERDKREERSSRQARVSCTPLQAREEEYPTQSRVIILPHALASPTHILLLHFAATAKPLHVLALSRSCGATKWQLLHSTTFFLYALLRSNYGATMLPNFRFLLTN